MRKKIGGFIILVFFGLCLVGLIVLIQKIAPVATKVVFHRNATVHSTNGRTNILLLGTGGANHDGPNLSDTIMIASLDPGKNTITLVSLPRDLWVSSLNNGNGGKINEAYADGQADNQQKGLVLAKSVIGNIINQPIHYGFRIDFGGFVKAVDLIGGIDVHVADTLDDYHYPIDGQENATCGHTDTEIQAFTASNSADQAFWDFFPCRYMHLHVDAGVQHMNGITALEFVRSRHGNGNEGSDFARSRRQQLVIEAFRSKVLSLGILLNPSKLIGLYTILKDSIDTDIPEEDIAPFISLFQKMKTASIRSVVVDDGSSTPGKPGLLIDTTEQTSYGTLFALEPRVGNQNFSEIQWYVACELTKGNCVVPQNPSGTPEPTK